MLYIIDTAHVDEIKKCVEIYPVAGVTTNPTIISKEHTEFGPLIKTIRGIIGPDKMLHIQTTSDVAEDIVNEALRKVDDASNDAMGKFNIPGFM